MRLLTWDENISLQLTSELDEDKLPPFAALSHTWLEQNEEEVTFEDITKAHQQLKTGQLYGPSYKDKAGYAKVRFCVDQARREELKYVWIDTCCIDKSTEREVSRAINSMYRWYTKATACYVFLEDVSTGMCKRKRDGQEQLFLTSEGKPSRWFNRGWTLQELLAPSSVKFFSKDHVPLGDKHNLATVISDITGIDVSALKGTPMRHFEVERRLAWAARRETKFPEDKIYCLLGIFDVTLPLVPGETVKAAASRLQSAICNATSLEICSLNVLDLLSGTVAPNAISVASAVHQEPRSQLVQQGEIANANLGQAELCKSLMLSLSFSDMTSRRSGIGAPLAKTCAWMLTHPKYLQWLNAPTTELDSHFIWIRGKPGCGKSTMVKYLDSHKKSTKTNIRISYYFHARGSQLQKRVEGMYRSLLHQIIERAPDIQNNILEGLAIELEDLDSHGEWLLADLQQAFSLALAALGTRRLQCFIDALDECEQEEVHEMIDFLSSTARGCAESGAKVSICLASRYYPTLHVDTKLRLDLDNEASHSEDMKSYIHEKLKTGDGEYSDSIRADVLSKANGIFMWAVLVVKMLNEVHRNGDLYAVQQKLRSMPPELDELFKQIITRDGAKNIHKFRLCVQLLLFAQRPLSKEEYYVAMAIGLSEPRDACQDEHRIKIPSDDLMARHVASTSKGLAEISKSDPTVQFIHESVRDFLLRGDGLHMLWSTEPSMIEIQHEAHAAWMEICRRYIDTSAGEGLSAEVVRRAINTPSGRRRREFLEKQLPLLGYVQQFFIFHAEHSNVIVSPSDLVDKLDMDKLTAIQDWFQTTRTRRWRSKAPAENTFAASNAPKLLEILLQQRFADSSARMDSNLYILLYLALSYAAQAAARLILKHAQIIVDESFFSQLPTKITFSVDHKLDCLMWALQHRQVHLARALMTTNSYISRVDEKARGRLWILCIERRSRELMELLHTHVPPPSETFILDKIMMYDNTKAFQHYMAIDGMKPEALDISMLLFEAKQWSAWRLIIYLIENGADPNAKNPRSGRSFLFDFVSSQAFPERLWTDLRDCGYTLWCEIIQCLLDHGAEMEWKDSEGNTALLIPNGDSAQVCFLVEQGADVHAVNDAGQNSLMCMLSQRGLDNTLLSHMVNELSSVRFLDINAQDKHGKTALMYAAGQSHSSIPIIQLLIDRGADVNARDEHGKTALMYAAGQSHSSISILQLLIDRGADVNARDEHGKTALMYAAGQRSEPTASLKLLIDRGSDVNARDTSGNTVLMMLAINASSVRSGCTRIDILQGIVLVIDEGVDTTVKNHHGLTALMMASPRLQDSMEYFRVMIRQGVDITTLGPPEPFWKSMNDLQIVDKLRALADQLQIVADRQEPSQNAWIQEFLDASERYPNGYLRFQPLKSLLLERSLRLTQAAISIPKTEEVSRSSTSPLQYGSDDEVLQEHGTVASWNVGFDRNTALMEVDIYDYGFPRLHPDFHKIPVYLQSGHGGMGKWE